MNNHYHHIASRPFNSSGAATIADIRTIFRRVLRIRVVDKTLTRIRQTIGYLLSTLVISTLFLIGIYLFLTQLAAYGW